MNMGRAICTAIGTVTWVHTQIFFYFIFILFYVWSLSALSQSSVVAK